MEKVGLIRVRRQEVSMIKLEKTIDPASLRGIGQRPSGLPPHLLPISARGLRELLEVMPGSAYCIGRTKITNAIVVLVETCAFLYVNPKYKGYRRLAVLRFPRVPQGQDIDHVLARRLACELGHSYVLVALVPQSANRSHGSIEKLGLVGSSLDMPPAVCFPDKRIYHKVLGRRPYARQSREQLEGGFDPKYQLGLGLTLKQAGIWNTALGLDQDTPEMFMRLLRPYCGVVTIMPVPERAKRVGSRIEV